MTPVELDDVRAALPKLVEAGVSGHLLHARSRRAAVSVTVESRDGGLWWEWGEPLVAGDAAEAARRIAVVLGLTVPAH